MKNLFTNKPASAAFLVAICTGAFLLRILIMLGAHTYRVVVDDTNFFGFGWEMGRVAASLAMGHGFSSPLPLPTGPTAIVAPIYPLILAGVFNIFGIYSVQSAIVIRIIQSAFSALTCLFLYLVGRDTSNALTGKIAAILWAIFPLNIFFTVMKVWETSLTSFLVISLFWIMLPLPKSRSLARWAAMGASLGVAALVSTSIAVIVVPFGISAIIKQRWRVIAPAVTSFVVFLAVLSPWLLRNRAEFGAVMIRSNFPLEFRIGNNDQSYGQKIEALHPSNTESVNRHWQAVGELNFMNEERAANSAFLKNNLKRFEQSTLNRVVNYWTGGWIWTIPKFPNSIGVIVFTTSLTLLGFLGILAMLRSEHSAALMFAGCLFIYPLAYCLTTTQPRFYHAVTPLLLVAGSFLLQSFREAAPEDDVLDINRTTVSESLVGHVG